MNGIKRTKNSPSKNLSKYKFGLEEFEAISDKIIYFSEKNERISFSNNFICTSMHCRLKEELIKKIINKKNPRLQLINKSNNPLYESLYGKYSEEIVMHFLTEENLDLENQDTDTVLHKALENKHPKEIIYLLIKEEFLNIKTKNISETPLHKALRVEYPEEVIRLLITKDNKNYWGFASYAPVHLAIYYKYSKELIKDLITNENKRKCLLDSMYSKLPDETIISLIDDDNIDDIIICENSITHLHYALKNNFSEEIVRALISKKNIFLTDHNGYLPIRYAINKGYGKDIIKELINPSILNSKDDFVKSIHDYAPKFTKDKDIIGLLNGEKID